MSQNGMFVRANALRKELEVAADSYYNSGIELMSNKEYDQKFDELKALEKELNIKDGFTAKVGAAASGKLNKVTHEYEAKSLGKTKDIEEIVGVHNDPSHAFVCLSWKCDGSTVQATYENGNLKLAATRGDGRVGQDITENAKYIEGLPQTIAYKGKLVVRGEALMTYSEFDRLNTNGQYANPRNLANATITALDGDILSERKVVFKAFELVMAEDRNIITSFSGRLDWLGDLGFEVVPHKKVSVKELKDNVAEWSKEEVINALGFPVDGLVVAGDDTEYTKDLIGTDHHPNLAKGMAFKWQDETVQTVLRDIEWSPSRTGLLNPVAIFDTVDLCGTKVSRASLHNVSYVDALNLKIGDRITVYKANMIIPQIDENLDKDKEGVSVIHGVTCPCCKAKAEIVLNEDSGTKVMTCPNGDCPAKELGRLSHFVSKHGMNIEGLSEKTLEMLIDKGLVDDMFSIYLLDEKRAEIESIEGFGKRATDNLLNAIEKSKNTDFQHLMYSFGIDGFGRGQVKLLKDYIDSLSPEERDDLIVNNKNESVRMFNDSEIYTDVLMALYTNGFDFSKIEGIGPVLAKNLDEWIGTHMIKRDSKALISSPEYMVIQAVTGLLIEYKPKEEIKESGITGKSFCITGSLENFTNRDECVEYIEKHGGKFVSGVSGKTDYLVNNDATSTSGKNKKAKELGIPVITEKQLISAIEDNEPLPAKIKKQIAR